MTYLDMTFCTQRSCANWDTCFRALTEEVIEGGVKWWGTDDFPVSIFTDKPDCFEENLSD
jgi:hypothetical protein